MSEVKDRHKCGECKWLEVGGSGITRYYVCVKHGNEYPHMPTDSDMEACSDFKPKNGWRE